MSTFHDRSWVRFPPEASVASWIDSVLPAAAATVANPANAARIRCGGTWFVGVNALPNAPDGSVAGGPPLSGAAMAFLRRDLKLDPVALDRGQVSVCYQGYPQPMAEESEAAFRFRRDRDAAHVDGLIGEGPGKRRFIREPHSFIIGIPLCDVSPGMSPLVVWEGSHEIMRRAFARALGDHPPSAWGDVDLTDSYRAARQEVFATCRRVEVITSFGECYIVHRLALHGVAPWGDPKSKERPVIYFRPLLDDLRSWLFAP
ncbi:MAG: hypothetical protein U1F47_12720 [Hyphomicrobiales bacterium]